jgi:hypothetical protein
MHKVQEGVRMQRKSQIPLPSGATLTRERYLQRVARREQGDIPLHARDPDQARVSEPTMVGLPDMQRQVATVEAMLGAEVRDESSGSDMPAAGEACGQSRLVANHAYGVQAHTVGAPQAGQSSAQV